MKLSLLNTSLILVLAGCSTTPPAAPPATQPTTASMETVLRFDPAIDALIPKDVQIERVRRCCTNEA